MTRHQLTPIPGERLTLDANKFNSLPVTILSCNGGWAWVYYDNPDERWKVDVRRLTRAERVVVEKNYNR